MFTGWAAIVLGIFSTWLSPRYCKLQISLSLHLFDLFSVILDMNRTLLVEEGDDEGDNRQDKKKREKEKFPDVTGNT